MRDRAGTRPHRGPRAHSDRLLSRRTARFLLRRRDRGEAAAAIREHRRATTRGLLSVPGDQRIAYGSDRSGAGASSPRAGHAAHRRPVSAGRDHRPRGASGLGDHLAIGGGRELRRRRCDRTFPRRRRADTGQALAPPPPHPSRQRICRRGKRQRPVGADETRRMMEGFQPWLMVSQYIATRSGDADRGPLVRLHPSEARKRLLEDGELVWVYGPRRHELAVLVVDDTVSPGNVVARDILGIAPAEIVRVVKHDFDAGRSTSNLG
ncbi:MAG: hypothetical protein DMD30_02960 [Gemmatimonadetes bacterium]|nr:MAG: hypothetical protein DMD30_02960 [Gemmatimonadota bacterium]PYP54145.1 MAG: hypothetical protein DMD39_02665 [Gemmatimonadota bacterium]